MVFARPVGLTRRALLTGALAAAAGAGCSWQGDAEGGRSSSAAPPGRASPAVPREASDTPSPPSEAGDASAPGSPDAAAPPVAEPPGFPPYEPLPTEVEPGRKVAAMAVLAAALTVRDTTVADTATGVRDRVAAAGQLPEPATVLAPLLEGVRASSLRVVYPQSGGLSDDRTTARVMAVAEQHVVRSDAPDEVEIRSLTVRFATERPSGAATWTVTEVVLPPAVPARSPAQAPAAAQALLANPRVVLPEAARLDLLGPEGIDERIVATLAAMAERWVVDVSVLRSGHSTDVFGTDRTSNHAVGRGVDVWALDGIPVIEKARSPWREAMELAAALGASEVGGPEELAPAVYFTNASHQDHVHIGFAA